MHVGVSWWLLGVIAAVLGPILLRAHVHRIEARARERTRHILARALEIEAGRKKESTVDPPS
jgi:hypothetical protein